MGGKISPARLDMTAIQTGDPLPIENRAIKSRRNDARPFAVASLVIVCFMAWLMIEIPKGILSNTDEVLTAERSREMLLTSPWVVHFNFQRSFAKPPLQYWITSLTLPRLENRTLAVRLWPLLYGVLTAITLAVLARVVAPDRPWVVPLSLALLVTSKLFSAEASRALLDTGLAFFTTVAILCTQLARRNPQWWLGVAVACWLGSLQKIPLIFLVWLLILIVRGSSPVERRTLFSGWLVGSIVFAMVASAMWPLLQLAKYGMPVKSVFNEEVVVWLGPEHLGARPYLEIPSRLTTTAWIGGGLFAFAAAFAVLLWKKQRFSTATKEVAILRIGLIALAVLFNFRSVRYMVPIVPCLCLLLAVAAHRLLEQRSWVRVAAAVGTALILIASLTQAATEIHLRQRNTSVQIVNGKIQLRDEHTSVVNEKRVAEELGSLQKPSTKMVLVKAIKTGNDLLYDSFYLFHGNLRFPVAKLTVEELRATPPSAPVLGVCVARDFSVVQETYPNVQTLFARAQFILWRVDAR
jgi:4-amino-4-deoxy-L-arabinose transferase-like glycosyltransferase